MVWFLSNNVCIRYVISKFTASQRSLLLTAVSRGRKKNTRLSNRNKSQRVFCQAIQAFIHLLLHAEYWEGRVGKGRDERRKS